MASAEGSITINRPVQEVFAFISDKANDTRWSPSIIRVERVSGDGAVGTKYRQVIKVPGRGEVPTELEVTSYDPGKRYAFRGTDGPVKPEGSFDLADEGGATRVTFKLDAQLSGPAKLMGPMVGKGMRSEVEALDRLKQVLETG
jgi:carbon monoxide dehydrogenase subunit G